MTHFNQRRDCCFFFFNMKNSITKNKLQFLKRYCQFFYEKIREFSSFRLRAGNEFLGRKIVSETHKYTIYLYIFVFRKQVLLHKNSFPVANEMRI